MNLDRVLPPLAPIVRRMMRSRQTQREAQFKALPPVPQRVVFLGDSITEWTAWEDWFPELQTTNRGIGGQAICDVLARLDTAIVEPRAISLHIGTNDLHGLGKSDKVPEIIEQMQTLVRRIRGMAPAAILLVNSVMPRSALFRDRIIRLNEGYRTIASENGATFVDVWSVLARSDGVIRPEFTSDGLHLSLAGYKAWADMLRPHLEPFKSIVPIVPPECRS